MLEMVCECLVVPILVPIKLDDVPSEHLCFMCYYPFVDQKQSPSFTFYSQQLPIQASVRIDPIVIENGATKAFP